MALNQLQITFFKKYYYYLLMTRSKILILIFFILLNLSVYSLKVSQHQDETPKLSNENQIPQQNKNNSLECSREFCINKYGLLENPFDPHCQQDAKCWRKWFGLPDCKQDDIKCWKTQVGYPQNCDDNDYDCWIKAYGYVQCEDAKCMKQYLNYTCAYDDLACWKQKSYMPKCKWNDWDCWYETMSMKSICRNKIGYKCVSYYFGRPCDHDDQDCWRQILLLPDSQCQKKPDCLKQFYLLPTCKDDDLECWKQYYYGPDCKKGDMECLKKSLWIPDCKNQKDQLKCYKKWLGYPDCSRDDGKCWKMYNDQFQNGIYWAFSVSTFSSPVKNSQHHNLQRHNHRMSFGQMMKHKRAALSQSHKLKQKYHQASKLRN